MCGRQLSWPNYRRCSRDFLEEMRKPTTAERLVGVLAESGGLACPEYNSERAALVVFLGAMWFVDLP
jgi:hypothetical protein